MFERDGQTRRSKARADLKAQTGWGDEQIEGWKIMLERDVRIMPRGANACILPGAEPADVVCFYSQRRKRRYWRNTSSPATSRRSMLPSRKAVSLLRVVEVATVPAVVAEAVDVAGVAAAAAEVEVVAAATTRHEIVHGRTRTSQDAVITIESEATIRRWRRLEVRAEYLTVYLGFSGGCIDPTCCIR